VQIAEQQTSSRTLSNKCSISLGHPLHQAIFSFSDQR
jgi:hypothetical protein